MNDPSRPPAVQLMHHLVYPDFGRHVIPALPPHVREQPAHGKGERLGGIDFGFGNGLAAVWAVLDRDGVLYVIGEHCAGNKAPSQHAGSLPRDVTWYADPSHAGGLYELCRAGFVVHPGKHDLRSGIAAVGARLRAGTLKVVAGRCPNLLAEAELYRYEAESDEGRGEVPVDDHHHALAALPYLVRSADTCEGVRSGETGSDQSRRPSRPTRRPWLRYDNEALWIPIF